MIHQNHFIRQVPLFRQKVHLLSNKSYGQFLIPVQYYPTYIDVKWTSFYWVHKAGHGHPCDIWTCILATTGRGQARGGQIYRGSSHQAASDKLGAVCEDAVGTCFTKDWGAHNSNLVKIDVILSWITDQIRSQFCTCHDSSSVVTCRNCDVIG